MFGNNPPKRISYSRFDSISLRLNRGKCIEIFSQGWKKRERERETKRGRKKSKSGGNELSQFLCPNPSVF